MALRDNSVRRAVARSRGAVLADGTWRYYLGFAIGRMSGFAVLPVLTRVLGISGFGRFEPALAALIAATIVVDAGLASALVRFIGDPRWDAAALLRSAARLQLRASALAVVVVGPLVVLAAPSGSGRLLAMGALVVFAVFEGLATLGSGLCRATGRDGLYLVLSGVRFATTVAATLIGALLFESIGALFGVALGGLGFALYGAVSIAQTPAHNDPAVRRSLMRYGFPLVATSAMTWSLTASDRLFLQRTSEPSVVGAYAANYRLGSLIFIFIATPIALTWVPAARRAMLEGDLDRTKRRWMFVFTAVAWGGVTVLVLLGPVLIPAFFGPDFSADRLILLLVAGSGWLGGLYYFVATPFLLGDDTRPLIIVSGIVIALNLGLNGLLITSYETRGAAAAAALSFAGLFCATVIAARMHGQREDQVAEGV